jgi:hypothetical protein
MACPRIPDGIQRGSAPRSATGPLHTLGHDRVQRAGRGARGVPWRRPASSFHASFTRVGVRSTRVRFSHVSRYSIRPELNRGRPPWSARGRSESDARYTRDLYRDNGPQHSQSENHTSHDLSCLVLATSHSHAHVSRANTTARRESPQPMPRGSSMPRTESARVHMQGAGRVRRCSLFAPRAPLIHPMTSASSTHAVSRVLRPCRCHSCLPGISLVSPSDLPGLPLPFPRRCCFVQSRPWFWPWL